jgi:hypothetical protein
MISWVEEPEPRKAYSQEEVRAIINAAPTFSAQVDELAKVRHWERPRLPGWSTIPVLDAYLSGDLTAEEAVDQLATRIEQAWVQELKQPAVNPDDTAVDTQSGIMDLWLGVIHAAKKSRWDDETDRGQQDLLHLLETFKNRLDPEITEVLFPKRTENWLYSWTGGKLWSELSLIGMALRESLDDGPHRSDRCTEPDIQAYFNFTAFTARMTVTGVRDVWTYATWAMRDSTESARYIHQVMLDQNGVRLDFQTVLVWLTIAGKQWWEKCRLGPHIPDVRLDVNVHSKKCPWISKDPIRPGTDTTMFAKSRWRWWKGMFGLVAASKGDKWSEGTKQLARKIQASMGALESAEEMPDCDVSEDRLWKSDGLPGLDLNEF